MTQLLGRIPDHRRAQGRRYQLGVILALGVVAVLCGAKTLAPISRPCRTWDTDTLAPLGLRAHTRTGEPMLPVATTLGRTLAGLDADALDDAIGSYLTAWAADPTVATETTDDLVGLAVDGKTVAERSAPTAPGSTCWRRPPPRRAWSSPNAKSGPRQAKSPRSSRS